MSEPCHLNLWVREDHKGFLETHYRVEKTLFSEKSPFQQIDVVETAGLGRMLLNDGIVMLSERDEFVYHEMIAHVPLFVHPNPRRVLVIGGGDGGSVREIMKHSGIERVVMVEIDEVVVRACRAHMPDVSCALDDPRLELRIQDGVHYMAQCRETFDLVIVDSTDPIGPATPLFNRDFYQQAAALLGPDGILVSQAESPFYDPELQGPMLRNQRPFFARLHLYLFSTLTYPGGTWSFGFASKGPCPLADFDPQRVAAAGLATRYYNPGIHRAAFMLPTFVRDTLAGVLDPLGWPDPEPR